MSLNDAAPAVSVVMPTYNRSNILAFSTGSVRWQTFADWELIVVDDASTDDTADVVRDLAAADPRIRLVTLASNSGEQSIGNNVGFEHARGRFIAYLNHDDLWFPDHLERALDHLEATGADLSFSLPMTVAYEDGTLRFYPVNEEMHYHPTHIVPASCWVFRRGLLETSGKWRPAAELWGYPSQEVLWRWWRQGRKLHGRPQLTCLQFPSGNRARAYARRDATEISRWYGRIRDEPGLREEVLTQMVLTLGRHDNKLVRSLYRTASEWLRSEWSHLLARRGIEPQAFAHKRAFRHKGGWFAPLRAYRGLPPHDKLKS